MRIACLLLSFSLSFSSTLAQLTNGNFSNGYTGWSTSTPQYWYVNALSCQSPVSGGNYAYFGTPSGGYVDNAVGSIEQQYSIPSNATSINLSFYISINTYETTLTNVYDYLNIWMLDLNGNILQTVATLSNLDGDPLPGCQSYQPHTYSINTTSYQGQTVRIFFIASNDVAKQTVFRLDDISVATNVPTGCITWINGTPTDPVFLNATEYLCQHGVIDNIQDNNNFINGNSILCKDAAYYCYNSLFANAGYVAYSDNFPAPEVDVNSLPTYYSDAIKAMLYLEYSDGTPCFSRDYFNVGPNWGIVRGRAVREILEAWNIAPDWSGYNINSFSPSSFLCDVAQNDIYYGWMLKAYNLGFFNGLTYTGCGISCGANLCFGSQQNITEKEFLIILYRVMNYMGGNPPAISQNDYFIPNFYQPASVGNNVGINNAVFNQYEKSSFDISGGGLPLTLSHSYHSNLSELPYLPFAHSVDVIHKIWLQRFYPLGFYWTHNYNIYILCIPNSINNNAADYRLMVYWGDGRIESYDPALHQYETIGVKDNLIINSYNSTGNATSITITKPDGTKFNFNRFSTMELPILEITSIQDRNSNSLNFSYIPDAVTFPNTNGGTVTWNTDKLHTITDSFSGRVLTFNYQSGTNFISSVIDNTGRAIQFNVDATNNDLTDFYDAKGNHTQYIYGTTPQEKHLLKHIILPKGNTIDNNYFNRKLTSSSNNSNYNIQVNWNQNYLSGSSATSSQVSVTQNGNTLTTDYTHDSNGSPVVVSSPSANMVYQYNDGNNPTSPTYIHDNNTGITTNIQYATDNKANPIQISTTGGGNTITEQFQYNQYSQVTQYTDPQNNVTAKQYDSNGNILQVNEPTGSTFFSYFPNHLLEGITDPVGLQTRFHYNTFGNLDSIYIPNTAISAGATYDAISRVTSIRNPNGIKTNFTYDNNDNVTDKYADAGGLNYHTQNSYDANDNMTSNISPLGHATLLTYDFLTDDLIQENYGSYNKTWTYNQDGTVNTFMNKNGTTFNYVYLPQGDPNAGKLAHDAYSQFTYNSSTKLLSSVTRFGTSNTIQYSYDGLSRVANINYNDIPSGNNNVQYEYKPNSNLLRKIYYPSLSGTGSGLTLEYTYDNGNRLSQVKNANTNYVFVTYDYHSDGKLNYEQYGNQTKNTYLYDAASRLVSILSQKQNGDTLALVNCMLDSIGNHIKENMEVRYNGFINPPNTSTADTIIGRQYDIMSRLINENSNTVSSNNNGAITTDNTYNNANLAWDERDNLLIYSNISGTTFYEYDGLENRRKRDTTRYVLDLLNNSNVLMETNLNGNPYSVYVHGLGLVCRIDPVTNSVYYYHYDFRGSTIAITDSIQEVIQTYSYDNFGKVSDAQGNYTTTVSNPFTYVGKYGVMDEGRDALYFMRARYYNADRGRFLSEDPVWDENLFPYGNNNPATNIDPNGDCPICLVLGEAGFGIATGYGIAKLTGQDYTWKNAAFDGALGAITAGASIYAGIAKIGAKGATEVIEQVVHGNSLKSLKPTWGYKLFSQDGTFLKNGITSKLSPEKRYTKAFMSDKIMLPVKQFPNRLEAWKWEFQQNQILRGLLNKNMH